MPKSHFTAYAAAFAVLATSMTTLGVNSAMAQSSADGPVDMVVVTGSNLRLKKDYSSPSPVQTVGSEDLAKAGTVKMQDLFKGLTSNSGSQTSNRQNALQGVSQFSLRGLGIGSTLTLLNGRRAGLSPVTDDTGQLFTDVNQFPVNMIERIEVLTDGASANYGSEAVAGVVNIITRDNFEGFELTAEMRDSTHTSSQFGLALGSKFDKGDFQIFVNQYAQDGNFRGDIDFIKARDANNTTDAGYNFGGVFNSGTGAPGKFQRAGTNADGDTVRVGNTLADPDCAAAGGILRGTSCRYNFIDQRRIIAEEERLQIFSQIDYDVNDRISFFGEMSFSQNEIRDGIGGAVLRRTTTDGGFLVPADHPFNFFVADGAENISYVNPANWDTNTHNAVPVIYRGRVFGKAFDGEKADDITTTFQNLRFMGGLDIDLNDNWILSTSYQTADNSYTRQQPRDFDTDNFQAALTDGSWNPFGTAIVNPTLASPKDSLETASNTNADLLSFSTTINEVGSVKQDVIELILSGETDMQLGGGNVAVAVGMQRRDVTIDYTPDGRRQSGDNGRNETEGIITQTKQEAVAYFAEALLPVSERLEAQVAARFEDYGDKGGDTFDPKVSLKYDVSDAWSARASYGTSYQAPSIRQVSGAVGSAGVTDPNNPNDGTFNVTVFTSGSPDLEPQSATNYNLGLVGRLDTLDISFDYFNYEYEDLVLPGGSAQSIVNATPNGPAVLRDAAGQLNAVFTGFENRGDASLSGIDVNAVYDADWFNNGDLSFNANVTLITDFTSTEFAGLDGNGQLKGSRNNGNAFGSTPDMKVNLGATWTKDSHTTNVTVRYIGAYEDDQAATTSSYREIDAQTTVDLRYTYAVDMLDGETEIFFGAVNLLDEDTPELASRPLFDTEVHDPRGRQFYAGVKLNF
jgi:iron complex outermembrane receptor protein